MLYIISTPIGNLKDISYRAVEILESIDILLCEDTRKTGLLLNELEIGNKPKLVSFYDEVEQQKIPQIIDWLKEGLEIGLVTDAGTPLISDPGWLLIKKCQNEGVKYTAIPGACALVNAAVLSGLPIQRFSFLGFLPKKSGDKEKLLKKYLEVEGVKIAYEAGNRTKESVEIIKKVFGEKTEVKICREMTKMFESVDDNTNGDSRGEVTLVFG
ncbi:MAG TPA: 16S rRNA (cytidine(1402)-2'-O)-methyltransferase [Candidatus Woesebacteria bacterium]|nr:16S rRNA (cytidine(1402)-2'-O)-methyltransferase [Candidatus Woesebacteria bacterium]HPJ17088.1 16S rRNA (cytidine(1402)-2'-O)-methyltransferase [Candidatus Woesebacteria bacterium]